MQVTRTFSLFLSVSVMLLGQPAATLASEVTTERIVILPDHAATSADTPATLGPSGEGSGISSGSVDGEVTGQSPNISADGLALDPSQEIDAEPPALATEILRDISALPAPVRNMHATIYNAARSGQIERLRLAIEMNELPPILGLDEENGDPIEQLRLLSGDAEGSEILAILSEILESGFVHVDQGTAHEMYVWPYFAHYPLHQLNPEQRVELFRLITASDYEEMSSLGQYIFFRLGISPDGTWHYFVAGE